MVLPVHLCLLVVHSQLTVGLPDHTRLIIHVTAVPLKQFLAANQHDTPLH